MLAPLKVLIRQLILANPVYAGALVTVYKAETDGTKTLERLNLYEDELGLRAVANPVQLDGQGKLPQPVYVDQDYWLRITGLADADHDTGIVRLTVTGETTTGFSGGNPSGVRFLASDVDQSFDVSNPSNAGKWRTGSGWTATRTITFNGIPPDDFWMELSNNSDQPVVMANGTGAPLDLGTFTTLPRGETIQLSAYNQTSKLLKTQRAWESGASRITPYGGNQYDFLMKTAAADHNYGWGNVGGIAEKLAPDGATDSVLIWDATAGRNRRVLINNLPLAGGAGGGHPFPGVQTYIGTTPVVLGSGALEVQRFTAAFTANVTIDLPASATLGLAYWFMRDVPLVQDNFSLVVRLPSGGATIQSVPAGYAALVYRGASAWEVLALAPLALVISGVVSLGSGAAVLESVTAAGQARFKSLRAGAGIQLNTSSTEIEIQNLGTTGEINTGANVGDPTGIGTFDSKSGVTLNMRRLRSTTNRLTAALSGQTIELTLVEANLVIAAGQVTGLDAIATTGSADDLADGATNVAMLATERTKLTGIQTGAEANLAANVGGGIGLWRDKVASTLNFKSLVAGAGVTLTPAADTVQIDATGAGGGEANTVSNIGAGDAAIFKQKTGVDIELRTLTGIGGLIVAENGDVVEISGAALAGHPNVGTDVHATDTNLTLAAATSKEVQDLTAVFTADRDVELPVTGDTAGLYYIVRRSAAIDADAFLARVRLPSAGTVFVDVPAGFAALIYRDTTTWRALYLAPIAATSMATVLSYAPLNFAPADASLRAKVIGIDDKFGTVDGRLDSLETAPAAHAATHVTGGGDAIQLATAGQPGLMSSAYAAQLDSVQLGLAYTPVNYTIS